MVYCSTEGGIVVAWSVTGGGSMSDSSGTVSVFTAPKSPATPTVWGKIGAVGDSVGFSVIPPTGMTCVLDYNTLHGTPGAPLTYIGQDSIFECTVTPTTVTFRNVEFRENIPGEVWVWPDDSYGFTPPDVVEWSVSQSNHQDDDSAMWDILRSRLWNGEAYESKNITIRVPEEYKNESDVWTSWLPDETHPKEFRGVDQYGRGSISATNEWFGSWQRPYHY